VAHIDASDLILQRTCRRAVHQDAPRA